MLHRIQRLVSDTVRNDQQQYWVYVSNEEAGEDPYLQRFLADLERELKNRLGTNEPLFLSLLHV